MTSNAVINAEGLFQGSYRKAGKMMKKPGRIDRLLKDLEVKLKGLPILDDRLAVLPRMAMMVNSYIRKEYTKVPIATIFALVASIFYFVSPIDFIPDFFPAVGFLDDIAVVSIAMELTNRDIKDYMNWRLKTGLDTN